jgi:predicted GIY-YIG superfamily endonuclease
MYYVYLIRNSKIRKTYIGSTNDLRRRLREHKSKKPELIYYEAYKNERDAREREEKLKQRGQTVQRLKERLKYSLSEQ